MSIGPVKSANAFQVVQAQTKTAERVGQGVGSFEKVLGEIDKLSEYTSKPQAYAAGMTRLMQLRMLQGALIEGVDTPENIFLELQNSAGLSLFNSQESQIIDRYYAAQQPALNNREPADRGDIDSLIAQVAEKVSLAPELIHSVVSAESAYDPKAVSHAGAQGLMQLMPDTAKDLGVRDSFDARENLLGGSRYLKQLLEKYDGDIDHALAAYNWGQGNVDRHGLENMPEETRNYLVKVKARIGKESA